MELTAEIPQVLSGVLEIHDLDGSRKLFLGQVPDPFRAISHDHFLLRPVPTSPLRLSVEAAGKLFGSFDRSRVGGAVFVSYWPAFGIQLGLCEDTAELDLICSRPCSKEEHSLPTSVNMRRTPGESSVFSTSSAASVEHCPCWQRKHQ
jgi:hypothetical protein